MIDTLRRISEDCKEIQLALKEHLAITSNLQYKSDIEKDVVTLDNLILIVAAVKTDIKLDRIGASTELLLRIAANDFKNKLIMIPEKKAKRKEIIQALKEIHSGILMITIRKG
jgi:hypothetical protein